jgi:hypothetical protein
MRSLVCLALFTLVPAAAVADPGVTVVDDEPTSQLAASPSPAHARLDDARMPSDTGRFREASVALPRPVDLDDGPGLMREHDVAPPHTSGAAAVNGDLVAELAARQLDREAKRHRRAIDGCLAAARSRAPAAAGALTIDFAVADRKLESVRVSGDDLHDAELASCLVTTARTFRFSLAAARFRWPVALHP